MREARAAAKLKSDHVARVHDIGRFDTGEPYMVIEYLDGQDLKSLLKATGPLDVELAVVFVLQACEALAEAHAAGIVHRDLKPSNLFVIEGTDGRPKIKLLDFGISKLTGALAEQAGMDLTHTSAIMGSPLYMSPEQMASTRDIDARTDVWGLGVIFYQLVTGKRPFRGKTVTAVTISVTNDTPKTPSTLRPDIPEELDDIILKCLEKDPDQRYASVAELANDLVLLAPPYARALIDKIERVAARSPSTSGRYDSFSSSPGSSGSFDAIASGSRPIVDSSMSVSISGTGGDDVPDDAPTVRTGDSQHPKAIRLAGSAAEPGSATAATWQANTESIELPTHKSRWPLFAAIGGVLAIGIGVFAFRGASSPSETPRPGLAPSAENGAPTAPVSASANAPAPSASTPPAPSKEDKPPKPAEKPPKPDESPAPSEQPKAKAAPKPGPKSAPVPVPPRVAPRPKPKDPFGPGWR